MENQQESTTKKERPRWAKPYLEALALTGNHGAACFACDIERTTPYALLKTDEDFRAEREAALDAAADLLVLEARRRAKDGVDEPVIWQGQLSGTWLDAAGQVVAPETPGATMVPLTVKKYSDPLLMFLIKKERPEYRDQAKVELTGAGGGPMEMKHSGQLDVDVFARIDRDASQFVTAAERELREEAGPENRAPEGDRPPDDLPQ